jgi:hypothetical protein
MEDYFDDFEDDFDEGEFMEHDQFEDDLEEDLEMDEQNSDGSDFDDAPEDDESHDGNFTAKDAFILGGGMGWAYSKGQEERERQRLIQKSISKKIKKANQ